MKSVKKEDTINSKFADNIRVNMLNIDLLFQCSGDKIGSWSNGKYESSMNVVRAEDRSLLSDAKWMADRPR